MSIAGHEERRLVTCMFVDLVGSTDLTMRLGAERLKRELDAAFGELSRIIAEHGGTVEKYIGDAIYALFGAPVAHEDDPLRALRAAEAIRDWCLTTGARHGHPFAVRVGVETGEAVVDLEAAATTRQQMSVGPVVNIAARLQQRAEPGEVLVGPTTRSANEGAAELEELGPAELKGIGALPIWRLVRVGAPRLTALPFVGREAELGLLTHAHQRALKGRSVLAVVSGPPGQGKTRLVQEFLARLANGSHLIATRCRPADEVGVFAPFRDVLGVTTLDALAEQVGRMCSDDIECERVVAGLAESAGISTSRSLSALPAAEREDEIAQAWRRYVGMLGQGVLVILAVDDIHWADPSLVRLVDRITFSGPQVLVIATARPEFAEAAGIRPTGDRFFIELEGLEPDESRRLAAIAGRDDEQVVARAEGNPLFLVELARAGVGGELPVTLQGALGARLDQLPPADRALLSFAAVVGERFTSADAAMLAGRDVTEAGRVLARLADLHFLDISDGSYRFHHGLVREVAHGRLLTAERLRAHARFARERVRGEESERRAYHWWEALGSPDAEWVWNDDPDLPKMRSEAFDAHLDAGRRHGEHLAVDQAFELLGRALSFAQDDRQRAEAHHGLGVTYQRLLRQDETWRHLREALELYQSGGTAPLDVYVDLLEAAVWYGAFSERPADAEVARVAEEGTAAASAAGDLRALARMLLARARYEMNVREGQTERVAPYVEAAAAAAEASGDASLRRNVLSLRIGQVMDAGRHDEMGPLIAEATRTLEAADPIERLHALMQIASYHFAMAEHEAHDRTAEEAIELAERMGPHNQTHAWEQASEMYVARGEWDKARDLARRTARLMGESKDSTFCGMAAMILRDGATAQALAGEREDALSLLEAAPRGQDWEPAIFSAVPRALLGFPSAETDAKLKEKAWHWSAWADAATRAVILGRPDDAERAVERMGAVTEHSVAYRALAEGVREAVREMRGGPAATHEALRRIGYLGWIDILKRRVSAEY